MLAQLHRAELRLACCAVALVCCAVLLLQEKGDFSAGTAFVTMLALCSAHAVLLRWTAVLTWPCRKKGNFSAGNFPEVMEHVSGRHMLLLQLPIVLFAM